MGGRCKVNLVRRGDRLNAHDERDDVTEHHAVQSDDVAKPNHDPYRQPIIAFIRLR
jgi:hypothetical protein